MEFKTIKNTIKCNTVEEHAKIQIANYLMFDGFFFDEKKISCLLELVKQNKGQNNLINKDDFIKFCIKQKIYSRKDIINDFIDLCVENNIIIQVDNEIGLAYNILLDNNILLIQNIFYADQK